MKKISAFLILVVLSVTSGAISSQANGLASEAESFATGKSYKLNPTTEEQAAGKYDCTTFVQAVLRKASFNVGGATGNKINIVLSEGDKAKLKELVEAKDKKIQGVVTALADSGQGSEIASFAALKPGDIIQMWRISGGSAKGHAGIVKVVNVAAATVTLVGAHVDGVGSKDFKLNSSSGGWPIWFAVRPAK